MKSHTIIALLALTVTTITTTGICHAEFTRHVLSDKFYGEGASVADINKDGHLDIVSGPFWYAGPDYKTAHEIYFPRPYPPGTYSDNFFSWTHDVNEDGWADVIVVGFPGKQGEWFENPQGKEDHWKEHVITPSVDNESPTFADITGDGIPELIFTQGGFIGYASVKKEGPWDFVKISEKGPYGKFTHGLGYGDVNGDGKTDLLAKNGWWQQGGEPGKPWKHHAFTFTNGGGSQMYTYDFDGDGDMDVLSSLAAHSYGLAWFEQHEGTFKKHIILSEKNEPGPYNVTFSQLHAVELVDMNGDGLKDIITGKRFWAHNSKDPGGKDPAVLYWFETKRNGTTVTFVPHKIDDDSGVGTEVTVTDLNQNKKPDIIVGNKKGTFVHIQ